jgi:hypothetical protein
MQISAGALDHRPLDALSEENLDEKAKEKETLKAKLEQKSRVKIKIKRNRK